MVAITLDYTPRRWQRECHTQLKRFSVLVLHRRAGKTQLALMQLLDRALRCSLELGLFAYIAPFLKQAKAIAWARLKQILTPLIVGGQVAINESELSVRVAHNGAVVRLFGADNADALRGLRLDGVVLDEVAQIAPDVWVQIVQPALADRQGWAVFIGTVGGVDLFSELYFRAAGRSDWHRALYTVYDTDTLPEAEVERLKLDMSPTAFAREMLCDFAASGDDQLISLHDARAAAERHYDRAMMAKQPVVLGVDVARFGDDRSIVCRRQGLLTDFPRVLRGLDNMEVADVVAAEIVQHNPAAVFIDVGGGAGVIDRLRQLGHTVVEVNFGSRALKGHAANRRAEMWVAMRDWLRSGGAIPDDPVLLQELATPKYHMDASGRLVLEAKADIKKRLQGGASPDLADALALTFAAPVPEPDPFAPYRVEAAGSTDYDPLRAV